MAHIYPDRSSTSPRNLWTCYVESNILRMPIKLRAASMTNL